MKRNILFSTIICLLFVVSTCIAPIEPEFQYKEGIIFIDAYAVTEIGQSSISIEKSVLLNGRFYIEAVKNAIVQLVNIENDQSINCSEEVGGFYNPPEDFVVQVGETWKLLIELPDGRYYESNPEKVNSVVPIKNIKSTFLEESIFWESAGQFVPGHEIRIDWNDPVEEKNYYLWKYRTFEPLIVCKTCEDGTYRNETCQNQNSRHYYDYLCDVPCWMIRYGNQFQIYDDRLKNGTQVIDHKIANIPFFRRQDILIEIQQLSLTKTGYEYFKIIDDIITQNSGLNAPPPVALSGNLINVNDPTEVVLGQFIATASSTLSIFIDRSNISAEEIAPDHFIRLEEGDFAIYDAPCIEGRFRTLIKPKGWK